MSPTRGITQCYLTQVNASHLTPARKAATQFTYLGWVEGCVDLGGWLHIEMVYPPTDGHPSKYQ